MSRSLRRGAIAALVLAAIVPLSACAAGSDAATLQIKPDNAATSIGQTLRLNNILVVTPARTAAEGAAEATTPANITANISNTGTSDEVLQSIEVAGAGSATFTDAKGASVSEIVIPAGGAVLLGGPGQPVAHLAPAKLPVGGYADASFAFRTAGKVSVPTGVRPATGLYASFGPKAEPTPSATASATATASPTAGASASATATGSATATATSTGTATASASASAR